MKLILTCEHGGNNIPKAYKAYFTNTSVLESHRGYDLGALTTFTHLKPLSHKSFYSTNSRLFIELNRSLHHKNLFSEFTSNFSKAKKNEIIDGYYLPYREKVENEIKKLISNNETVLHLSVHSFTPILNGTKRHCDIGLLFDSTKKNEKEVCKNFKKYLLEENSELRIRFNYPYLGKADGFTTYLRKQFDSNYLGIEIEVNQNYSKNNNMDSKIKNSLLKAIKKVLAKNNL